MRAFKRKSEPKADVTTAPTSSKPTKSLAKSLGLLTSTSRPRLIEGGAMLSELSPDTSPSSRGRPQSMPPAVPPALAQTYTAPLSRADVPPPPPMPPPPSLQAALATPAPPKPPARQQLSSEREEFGRIQAELQAASGGMRRLSVNVVSRLLQLPEKQVKEVEYVEDAYVLEEQLGSGQCANVFRATSIEGKELAIKLIEVETLAKTIESLGMARAEVEAMKKIPPHPSILKLIDIACTPNELVFALELMPRGDLLGYILDHETGVAEVECKVIFKQLADGMHHMHSHGWAHRDLKPENVGLSILANGELLAKWMDFGTAAECKGDEMVLAGYCGTPVYMPPEVAVWLNKSTTSATPRYGLPADCWSLGVLLYVMLSGEAPWDQDMEVPEMMRAIQVEAVPYPDDIWSKISEEGGHLVRQLLKRKPQARLNARQICAHEWLTGKVASPPVSTAASPRASMQPDEELSSRRLSGLATSAEGCSSRKSDAAPPDVSAQHADMLRAAAARLEQMHAEKAEALRQLEESREAESAARARCDQLAAALEGGGGGGGEAEVEELRARCRSLEAEAAAQRQAADAAEAEAARLREGGAEAPPPPRLSPAAAEEMAALRAERDELLERCTASAAEVGKLRTALQAAQAESIGAAVQKRRCAELEEELAAMSAALQEARAANGAAAAAAGGAAPADVATLQARVAALEAERERQAEVVKADKNASAAREGALKSKCMGLEDENVRLSEKLSAIEAKAVTAGSAEREAARADREAERAENLEAVAATLRLRCQDLERRAEQLSAELEAAGGGGGGGGGVAEAVMRAAAAEGEAADSEIDGAKAAVARAEARAEAAEGAAAVAAGVEHELRRRLQFLEAEVDQMHAEVEAAVEARVEETRQETEHLRASLQNAQRQRDGARRDLFELELERGVHTKLLHHAVAEAEAAGASTARELLARVQAAADERSKASLEEAAGDLARLAQNAADATAAAASAAGQARRFPPLAASLPPLAAFQFVPTPSTALRCRLSAPRLRPHPFPSTSPSPSPLAPLLCPSLSVPLSSFSPTCPLLQVHALSMSLTEERSAHAATSRALEACLRTLQAELRRAEAEADAARRAQALEARAKVSSLEALVARGEQEKDNLREQLSTARIELALSQRVAERLEEQFAARAEESRQADALRAVQAELDARDARIAQLQETEASLRNELQSKRKRMAAADEKAARSLYILERLEQEKAAVESRLAEEEARSQSMEVALSAMRAARDDEDSSASRRLRVHLQMLQQELHAADLRLVSMAMILSARSESSAPTVAALQNEVDALRRSLVSADEEKGRAQEEWEVRTQRLRIELESERARKEAEIARQVGAAEREWRERFAHNVTVAREEAARAAREEAEAAAREQLAAVTNEWRDHLARAVLLTRQEVDAHLGGSLIEHARSPMTYASQIPGSRERLELLSEFGSAARLGIKRHAQYDSIRAPKNANRIVRRVVPTDSTRDIHPPGPEGAYGKWTP
ncbi:hypothetical protein AB1Y20_006103 [Prymnesium parvum]|uniref:Protein kinase domain-containing protein n=1 Tax=Prymnesium parvum TaxID=97485 RepID=A0AB34J3S1_PRYPA